jgi:hypothetical protein
MGIYSNPEWQSWRYRPDRQRQFDPLQTLGEAKADAPLDAKQST